MSRVISIDDDTYNTLKQLAKDNERTMIGQFRYMVRNLVPVMPQAKAPVEGQKMVSDMEKRHKSERYQKIQTLKEMLDDLDEDSEEYNDILHEILELQKQAD